MPPPPRITVRLSGSVQAKPGRGREAQVGVFLMAQAAGAEDGRQVLRLGDVVVQGVAFERPGQAIVEGEARVQLPGVLPVDVEQAVVVGLIALEGGRLVDVADAEDEVLQGQAEHVGQGVVRSWEAAR